MHILRLLFLFIVLGSGIIFLIRKLSFSQFLAPFVTVAGITVVLYVFSLVNFLKQGLIITVVLLLILGFSSFLNWPTKKTQEKTKPSPAIIAWAISFLIIAVYTTGLFFSKWDEFSYWGVIYRYLMATDHLPDLAANFLVKNYPPFTALFQYFVGTILKNSESSAYFAHMLLAFSAIIAVFPNNNWKDWKKYTAALTLGLISVFPLDLRFQGLYVDLILGLLFGAGLASAVFNNKMSTDRVTTVILASIALVLTKPLGIIFALVCISVLFIDLFFKQQQIRSIRDFWISLLKTLIKPQVILLISLTILAYVSWNIHVQQFNNTAIHFSINANPVSSDDIYPGDIPSFIGRIDDQEIAYNKNTYLLNQPNTIDISFFNILRIVTGNISYRTRLIIENFVHSFSTSPYHTLNVTCLGALLFILFVTLLVRISIPPNQREETTLSRNTIILLIGFVLYCFSILFAYIFYFSPAEGIKTPEVSRYVSSYLFGWWLLLVCMIYQQKSIEIPIIKVQASNIITIVLLFFLVWKVPLFAYVHSPNQPDSQRLEVNRIYKAIANKFTSEDKIYDIWQVNPSDGLDHYIMKYFLTPLPSNNIGWQISEKRVSVYTTEVSPSEWLELLNDQHFTYVLVCSSDEAFWNEYGMIFDTYEEKNVPQLFSVSSNGLVNVPITIKN